MVRSSFDSLLVSATVAPAIALPLGSVTEPCSEVDEVCGKTVPLTVSITKIEKSRHLARFMVPSPGRRLACRYEQQWAAVRPYGLFARHCHTLRHLSEWADTEYLDAILETCLGAT